MPSFLLFFRVVRNKLLTVSRTVDDSRHNDAANRNRAREEKMETYVNAKRTTKPTDTKDRYERQIYKLLNK